MKRSRPSLSAPIGTTRTATPRLLQPVDRPRQRGDVVGRRLQVADQHDRAVLDVLAVEHPAGELERVGDARAAAEALRPRRRRVAAFRRREHAQDRLELARGRSRREQLVGDVGEDDEPDRRVTVDDVPERAAHVAVAVRRCSARRRPRSRPTSPRGRSCGDARRTSARERPSRRAPRRRRAASTEPHEPRAPRDAAEGGNVVRVDREPTPASHRPPRSRRSRLPGRGARARARRARPTRRAAGCPERHASARADAASDRSRPSKCSATNSSARRRSAAAVERARLLEQRERALERRQVRQAAAGPAAPAAAAPPGAGAPRTRACRRRAAAQPHPRGAARAAAPAAAGTTRPAASRGRRARPSRTRRGDRSRPRRAACSSTSTGQRTSVDARPPPTWSYVSLTAWNSRDDDARFGTHVGPRQRMHVDRLHVGRAVVVAADPLRRSHELPRRERRLDAQRVRVDARAVERDLDTRGDRVAEEHDARRHDDARLERLRAVERLGRRAVVPQRRTRRRARADHERSERSDEQAARAHARTTCLVRRPSDQPRNDERISAGSLDETTTGSRSRPRKTSSSPREALLVRLAPCGRLASGQPNRRDAARARVAQRERRARARRGSSAPRPGPGSRPGTRSQRCSSSLEPRLVGRRGRGSRRARRRTLPEVTTRRCSARWSSAALEAVRAARPNGCPVEALLHHLARPAPAARRLPVRRRPPRWSR